MNKLISINFFFISVESFSNHSPTKLPRFPPYLVCLKFFLFHSCSPFYKNLSLPTNFPITSLLENQPFSFFNSLRITGLRYKDENLVKKKKYSDINWMKKKKGEMLQAFFITIFSQLYCKFAT